METSADFAGRTVMTSTRRALPIIGIALGLIIPIKASFADPGALPPGQLPSFTALWWEWVFSIPAPVNPTLDTTGANCMVGQRDFVWFLAGVNGGGSVTRACSVPADRTLFFPVINSFFINTPNCGQGGQNLTVKFMRTLVKPLIDAAQQVSVTVDGNDVKKTLLRRVQSDPFVAALPADNIFGPDACAPGVPLPAGIYSPSVDDGLYVTVPPLNPGPHTIHFQAQSGTFVQDVTYNLDIVPVLLK
jgi:hypothetical protein